MKQSLQVAAIFIFLFLAHSFKAQEYGKQLKQLLLVNDTLAQRNLIYEWETKSPNDADVVSAWYFFYLGKLKNTGTYPLVDANGKVIPSANSNAKPNESFLQKINFYLERGIHNFPSRLDFRFAKINLLGDLQNYKAYTEEIIKTIEYSKSIRNTWLWTGDVPQAGAKDFLLTTMQEYELLLYHNAYGPKSVPIEYMKTICETVLKNYPNNVESTTNLAIVYMVRKKYKKALALLKQAETLSPDDYVVLNNLAQTYKNKGDKPKAIAYYEKVVQFGDKEAREFAKKEIAELKKQ